MKKIKLLHRILNTFKVGWAAFKYPRTLDYDNLSLLMEVYQTILIIEDKGCKYPIRIARKMSINPLRKESAYSIWDIPGEDYNCFTSETSKFDIEWPEK